MTLRKCGDDVTGKVDDMAKTMKINGVDGRAIEKAVRDAYEADQDSWNAICGMGKPFATVLDLIDAKEKMLKADAVKKIGEMRSALMSLRIKRFCRMVEDDECLDVTEEELDAYIEARG